MAHWMWRRRLFQRVGRPSCLEVGSYVDSSVTKGPESAAEDGQPALGRGPHGPPVGGQQGSERPVQGVKDAVKVAESVG